MDRNVDRAFGLSLSVITYSLFLALLAMIYVTAYRYFDLKVSGEGMNQSLVKTQGYSQEEEDMILYTGQTYYRGVTPDGEAINTRLSGNPQITISKVSRAGEAVAESGEAVTGASVFAEIMSLPSNITRITIDGHTLYNDVTRTDQYMVDAFPNVAYYVNVGDTKTLASEADIDFVDNYKKHYIYDDKGYITQIIYTKL